VRRIFAYTGASVLALVVVLALVGPLTGYDVIAAVDPDRAFSPPSPTHPLGTDHLGRDIAWRLALAARHVVVPGTLAATVCLLLGIPLGAVAGWFGGWLADGIRYGFGVVQALPRFVVVLLALSIYGNDPTVLAVTAGLAYVPTLGEALFERIERLRNADYVDAHLAHGVPWWRILVVHLLWAACRRLVFRHVLGLFAFFLVLETTLSYLGFGVEQPEPSWGNMLAFDLDHAEVPWVALLAPAGAIWLTLAASTWARDGLADRGRDA
jgi:ABC-type dipeptide/oligopeptide/nickel transport system permease subunit